LPCVAVFAVHFPSGARLNPSLSYVFLRAQGKHLRTVTRHFTVRFRLGARQTQIFAMRFPTDARQSFFNAPGHMTVRRLTNINLCRAHVDDARQMRIVCRASSCDARQTCTFALRFVLAHGKGFLKNGFSYLLLIFPPLVHYFAL
jgi:hypothetical protein